MLVFKVALLATGCIFLLAEWTAEGTVAVITAVSLVLIPAITTLVTTVVKILRRVDETSRQVGETKDLLLNQNRSLNRIETTVKTEGDEKLPEATKGDGKPKG